METDFRKMLIFLHMTNFYSEYIPLQNFKLVTASSEFAGNSHCKPAKQNLKKQNPDIRCSVTGHVCMLDADAVLC